MRTLDTCEDVVTCARVSSWSWGTTSDTRPISFASSALGFHPSSSILLAFSSPMILWKCTEEQPSGSTPSCLKGVEKVARSLARVTSHSAGPVTPPPERHNNTVQ